MTPFEWIIGLLTLGLFAVLVWHVTDKRRHWR